MPARACRVMLLSRVPDAHAALVGGLRDRGAEVSIPRGRGGALEAIARRPDFLIVDLVHGAGLTPGLVERINRSRDATVVLALHDGSLGAYHNELADLAVEGFCRAGDPRPLVAAIAHHAPAVASTRH